MGVEHSIDFNTFVKNDITADSNKKPPHLAG